MLHRLIYADWENPPDAMAFEATLGEVLARIRRLTDAILPGWKAAAEAPAQAPARFWEDCLSLYLLTPALVNVALNYKICVEQGLPLHPTYYFELEERSRFQTRYRPEVAAGAQAFFLESIAAARAVFALDEAAPAVLERYSRDLPHPVQDFVYLSTRDLYTWRASAPARIAALAEAVLRAFRPALVVGAAHGSILSGLVFANMVGAPLYFVRFSMFKRKDKAPILSPSDRAHLAPYFPGPALLFDEDVAKGTTLSRFEADLGPLFREYRTASVLRHTLSPCWPDFVGHGWSD